eukprot:6921974-Heterocapsa_arctica.AAC.1
MSRSAGPARRGARPGAARPAPRARPRSATPQTAKTPRLRRLAPAEAACCPATGSSRRAGAGP